MPLFEVTSPGAPALSPPVAFTERLFEALNQFPQWLASFDSLEIPSWGVMLLMIVALIGLIFAIREFLSWFLKTNAIIDEVLRLKTRVQDLQQDLSALESTVSRLNSASTEVPAEDKTTRTPLEFRIDH